VLSSDNQIALSLQEDIMRVNVEDVVPLNVETEVWKTSHVSHL